MAKTKERLNQDEAFKSMMGGITPNDNDQSEAGTQQTDDKATSSQVQGKEIKEKYTPTSFYITDKHRKALKMKTALSNKPEDKDYSSIVRAALDAYLANILKDL